MIMMQVYAVCGMSMAVSTSGASHRGLSAVLSTTSADSPWTREYPKSASLQCHLLSTRTFAVFKSRCNIAGFC
jgi:hypothetical protein